MKNVAFNYSNTPLPTQFQATEAEETRIPLANEVTSIGKLIQQLKSEVNQLKSKLNQTDRLLVQKEIYAQNLKMDLEYAQSTITALQAKRKTSKFKTLFGNHFAS